MRKMGSSSCALLHTKVCKSCTIGTLHQITDASRLVSERVNSIHVLHQNTNSVTMDAHV